MNYWSTHRRMDVLFETCKYSMTPAGQLYFTRMKTLVRSRKYRCVKKDFHLSSFVMTYFFGRFLIATDACEEFLRITTLESFLSSFKAARSFLERSFLACLIFSGLIRSRLTLAKNSSSSGYLDVGGFHSLS